MFINLRYSYLRAAEAMFCDLIRSIVQTQGGCTSGCIRFPQSTPQASQPTPSSNFWTGGTRGPDPWVNCVPQKTPRYLKLPLWRTFMGSWPEFSYLLGEKHENPQQSTRKKMLLSPVHIGTRPHSVFFLPMFVATRVDHWAGWALNLR